MDFGLNLQVKDTFLIYLFFPGNTEVDIQQSSS